MAVSRPVIFIPGFPGTDLWRTRNGERRKIFAKASLLTQPGTVADILPSLRGPADPDQPDGVVPGQPIRRALRLLDLVDLAKQAESLYGLLDKLGYTTSRRNPLFRPFGWDWRRPVDAAATQTDLAAELTAAHTETGQATVAIVHSTGGLVLRALLEARPELGAHLHAIIAFGVPWAGTLKTATFLTGQKGFGPLTAAAAHGVMVRAWAAYDLLPPHPAAEPLGLVVDAADNPVNLLADLSWMPNPSRADAQPRAIRTKLRHDARTCAWEGGAPVPVWNVAGWGAATVRRAELGPAGDPRTLELPEDVDDPGMGHLDGDGTVPRRSVAWLAGDGVRTFELPVGAFPGVELPHHHGTLWQNPGGQDVLRHVLGGMPLPVQVHAAIDGDDAHGAADLRFRACAWSVDGQPLRDARFAILDPTNGRVLAEAPIPAGRGLLRVARAALPQTADGRFRRYRVKFTWTGGEHATADVLL